MSAPGHIKFHPLLVKKSCSPAEAHSSEGWPSGDPPPQHCRHAQPAVVAASKCGSVVGSKYDDFMVCVQCNDLLWRIILVTCKGVWIVLNFVLQEAGGASYALNCRSLHDI